MCVWFVGQIPCAMLSQRQMFHQDQLVRNYLAQASQRYADLREIQHRQSDELERLLSPGPRTQVPSKTKSATLPQHLPTFERKNTLLLTGKSKFYTMSYEVHCQTPSPVDDRPSTTTGRYRTIADDDLPVFMFADLVEETPLSNIQQSKSAGEILPYGITTSSDEASSRIQASGEGTEKSSTSDKNHNSIFWPLTTQCLGSENCRNPALPHTGNLCFACYQAKRYSSVVQYPTAMTKL